MKALIREPGETITENDKHIAFVDWVTGAPLTDKNWFGGPYHLVHDYDPDDAAHPVMVPQSEPEQDPDPIIEENEDDYVVIDGKRYSKTELRKLLE